MTEAHFSTTGRKRPAADVPFEQRLTCSVQIAVAVSAAYRGVIYTKKCCAVNLSTAVTASAGS